MAVNVSVFDLENFPSNPKTVTVDLTELVPFGNSGEDEWVFSAVTTATASGGAAIQRLYIRRIKFGWARSSGLSQGPYDVTGSQQHLKVAIDEAIGSAVELTLDTSGTALGGDAVAKDIQDKLNAAASPGGPKAGNLSYLNATCIFENGVFKIVSGSTSEFYTGSSRSSVDVADGSTTTGLAAELSFNIVFTSESFVSDPPKQTSLAANYTGGAAGMTMATPNLVVAGDCIAVTDGTNTEYGGVLTSVGDGVVLCSGLVNSYSSGSLVQIMRLQDPTGEPSPAHTTIDDFIKFSIASIANQIDFS